MSRHARFLLFTLAALLSFLAVMWLTHPRLQARLRVAGQSQEFGLPLRVAGGPLELNIVASFSQTLPLATRWRIIPDDELLELRVNGKPVSLAGIPAEQLKDWSRGFAIDLGEQLRSGRNMIELHIRNLGGPGGLSLRPEPGALGMTLLALPGLLWLLALQSVLRVTRTQSCLLLLGLVALLAYWSVTPWDIRGHDVGLPDGHFGYASFIADQMKLPLPNAGWTFFHPPLYYLIAAIFLRAADFIGFTRPETLQFVALGFWMIFLTACCATLRIWLRGHGILLFAASAALILWPSGIIHGIRISNDVPTYACGALATLYLLRWWKGRRWPDLWKLTLFCALALLFKTSAIAMAASAGLLLALRLLRPGRRGRAFAARQVLVFGTICSLGLIASLANNIYFYLHGRIANWLVANVSGISGALRVPNDLKSYIPLDLPTFLTEPWTNPWEDAYGRLNFWNYLLRSALSGEFRFEGHTQALISYAWGGMLLLLLVRTLGKTWRTALAGGAAAWRQLPLWVSAGLWIASVAALRHQQPYSSSGDFRYILPILVPAMLLAVRSGRMACMLLLGFALSSAWFFMTLTN